MNKQALRVGAAALAVGFALSLQANEPAKTVDAVKKISYKEAKGQCLKENSKLSGKELQKCIKNAEQKTL